VATIIEDQPSYIIEDTFEQMPEGITKFTIAYIPEIGTIPEKAKSIEPVQQESDQQESPEQQPDEKVVENTEVVDESHDIVVPVMAPIVGAELLGDGA